MSVRAGFSPGSFFLEIEIKIFQAQGISFTGRALINNSPFDTSFKYSLEPVIIVKL